MKKTTTSIVIIGLLFVLTGAIQAAEPVKRSKGTVSNVNKFNRLLKPNADKNLPPSRDGIHDTASPGTEKLLPPKKSFSSLPKSKHGNYVDWVKALEDGHIEPRWTLTDDGTQPLIMNLDIVREVKGSMPNVLYSHAKHTAWLDCANCHPDIFIPQKGANQISMASIMLGEKCGACHGRVSFPVKTSTCRLCHNQPKDPDKKMVKAPAKEPK